MKLKSILAVLLVAAFVLALCTVEAAAGPFGRGRGCSSCSGGGCSAGGGSCGSGSCGYSGGCGSCGTCAPAGCCAPAAALETWQWFRVPGDQCQLALVHDGKQAGNYLIDSKTYYAYSPGRAGGGYGPERWAASASRPPVPAPCLECLQQGPGCPAGGCQLAPHSPCPPTPNCQCGCTVTGRCVCKDCDHPQLSPATKP